MTAPTCGATAGPGDEAAEESVTTRLPVALARLSRALRRTEPSELGPGSVAALATVRREGPIRPGDLALREGVTPSTMTRIVALLENNQFLARENDPADRRAYLVRITEAGETFLTRLAGIRSKALQAQLDQLSPEERAAIEAALPVLETLAANLSR
ncbi:MarR family winged helix-turn-helix transcriptional regulator [Cryptosporangium aurantiacum]|uniref:DNA-binding transcriptional regulator, MarR family n=1 Tax=Cryptosporangium aurantiacum TaxID=134849 RepID=A0A1M7QM34_9ACTN|nr:MarR family transcriptional regulator [Cryptosporangium aurantiacum]SHN32305.1 DNA-binding transcriptional regulator, MarR family [Cryptosporangium aurantiacum]